jgi:hypothetical protein
MQISGQHLKTVQTGSNPILLDCSILIVCLTKRRYITSNERKEILMDASIVVKSNIKGSIQWQNEK